MSENIGRQFKWVGKEDGYMKDVVVEVYSIRDSDEWSLSYNAVIIEDGGNGWIGHSCDGALPSDSRGYFVSLWADVKHDTWNLLDEEYWEEVNNRNFWEVN